MSRPGDLEGLDIVAALGLLIVGVIGTLARPVKTYRLIRHGRGWYE